MVVFVCLGIYIGFYHVICHVGHNNKKITISWNLRQAHSLVVSLMKIIGDHKTLSIVRHM